MERIIGKKPCTIQARLDPCFTILRSLTFGMYLLPIRVASAQVNK